MKKSDCIINPKVGLGPILFGMPMSEVPSIDGFELVNNRDGISRDLCYENEEIDVTVHAMDVETVESIHCEDTAYLFGHNLIGLTVDQAVSVIGFPPDEWEEPITLPDDTYNEIADFDALGISLWFQNGRVASVILDDGDYED